MTLDPDQITITGHTLAERRALARSEATRRRHRMWATALDNGPRSVAELAAAWWPDIGEPRGWHVGSYPTAAIRRARQRVGVLVACGLAVLGSGCLAHRRQEGVVVVRARVRRGGR